jgi:DNA-binding CsgD family transcriptional regulator
MAKLTQAEHAVLLLVIAGCTTKDIARARHCTAHTVRDQYAAIRRKLNAHTLAHAVAIALTTGLG